MSSGGSRIMGECLQNFCETFQLENLGHEATNGRALMGGFNGATCVLLLAPAQTSLEAERKLLSRRV